jgi:hypothetical protein
MSEGKLLDFPNSISKKEADTQLQTCARLQEKGSIILREDLWTQRVVPWKSVLYKICTL